jgi:crotonobetainyl-CoA:carnitine CoA-transferase CaiB-like acyl-CoA transferase
MKDDIIAVSLQALGRGPYEAWATWAMNVMSYAGFTQGWGYGDSPMEERTGSGYHSDYIGAMTAAALIMGALFYRARTGKGQCIESSQAEVAASAIGPMYLDYLVNGRLTPPAGNRHPEFAPYNCYRCKDVNTWCVIAVRDDDEWEKLCTAVDEPSWLKDARFVDMPSRLKHVEELDRGIEKWTMARTPHQVMGIMQYYGVPAGAVQNSEDVFRDIQLRAGGFMVDYELPRLGPITFGGTPALFPSRPAAPHHLAPWLGQHNDYVFGKLLGLDEDERKKLEEKRVIY